MRIQQITLRLDADLVQDLERAAREEQVTRAAMMRRLLVAGLAEWRVSVALRDYETGRISIGKAVEVSRLTHFEFLELVKTRNVTYPIAVETTERRLRELPGV